VKSGSLLTKALFVVLLFGGYLSFSGEQTFKLQGEEAVLVADAPGMVYAQPAALLSATHQLQILVELLGQFPELKQNFQRSFYSDAAAEHLLVVGFTQYLRSDLCRISGFDRTDIISPFHHFF